MLTTLAVENYRSLRRLVLPLKQLNVITGANGSGKSSLYRALRLLADSARNGAVAALAREGGLPSTMWAGPEVIGRSVREGRHPVQGTVRTGPASLKLGFSGDDYGYAMDLGLPIPAVTEFGLDPEIKVECLWAGPVLRNSAVIAERGGPGVRLRDLNGNWQNVSNAVRPFDSMLSELADPVSAPELIQVRERIRAWRFYDHVRTDAHAPARLSQIGTRTPVLSHDGSDLAAALQTIREIGHSAAMDAAIDLAFEGSRVEITNVNGRFEVALRQPGMLRPLAAAELSDGTLRYLLWVAALLTPRPPGLMVLNEPETSLHPDLIGPLGALIREVAVRTQTVVVTHSRRLIQALSANGDGQQAAVLELIKENGETQLAGQRLLDIPSWNWPAR